MALALCIQNYLSKFVVHPQKCSILRPQASKTSIHISGSSKVQPLDEVSELPNHLKLFVLWKH